MSEKERTSVTLDPHIARKIAEDDAAFSRLVNRWAEEYYAAERRPLMDRVRIERWEAQLDQQEAAFESWVNEMREWFDDQRDLLEAAKEETTTDLPDDLDAEIDEFHEQVTEVEEFATTGAHLIPTAERDPENPAIYHKADRLGITADRLVTELKRRDEATTPLPKEKTSND